MCECVYVCACICGKRERATMNEPGCLFRSVTSSMPGKLNFISTYWYLGVQLGLGLGGGLSVKSNDGGGGREASCYVTNIIVVCVFLVLYGRFRILTWEGSFSLWHHPCRISWIPRVCLYCFSFSNYTFSIQRFVSLMYSVEYTYQGFIQWEASPGFHPRILGVE